MKTLISLLLFAQMISTGNHRKIFSSAPPSAPAWDTTVGHSCNPVFASPSSSYSCTITSTAGELALIGYAISGNNPLTSVTVDGVAATVAIDQLLAGSFGWQGSYYAANLTAGTHTVAVNYSAPVNVIALYVRQVTGASTTSPIDGTPTGAVFTVGSGANFACPSFTTTGSNDLIVAWGYTSSTGNVTAGSGYTLFPGAALVNGNSGGAWESQSGATAASYAPNFTNGNGGHQGCIGFGVKA